MAVVVVHGWDKTPCVSSVATCPTPWLSQPYQSGVSLTGVCATPSAPRCNLEQMNSDSMAQPQFTQSVLRYDATVCHRKKMLQATFPWIGRPPSLHRETNFWRRSPDQVFFKAPRRERRGFVSEENSVALPVLIRPARRHRLDKDDRKPGAFLSR